MISVSESSGYTVWKRIIPSLLVKAIMHHEDTLVSCYDIRPASLEHSHIGSIFAEVLCNIMTTVSSTHDDDLLAFHIVFRSVVMLASMVQCALELLLSRELGHLRLTRVTGAPNDMSGMEGSLATITSSYDCRPLGLRVIVDRRLDTGLDPDVQFHDARIRFEPVSKLVFRGELGPVLREREVCHVGEFGRVMGNQGLRRKKML